MCVCLSDLLFSIVIAVRNEKRFIKRCLQSACSQDVGKVGVDYEVVVVDGMSSDGTVELLAELQDELCFSVVSNELKNAAAGRNRGIEQSSGRFVAFVDGDAIPAKDWLSKIIAVFDRHGKEVAGVGGPDLLPPDSSEKEELIGLVMSSPLARGGRLNPSTQHSLSSQEKSVGHIPTCNLCLRREVLEQMQGFDESFVKGQDLELNHRIKQAGFKLLYSPDVCVVHYRKDSFRSFARQIFKWAKAKVAIIKKHGMQGFVSHVYLWPVYALLGLVGGVGLFWLLGLVKVFGWLFLLGAFSYVGIVFAEAVRLARFHNKSKLVWYAVGLIPVVHGEFFLGVWSALLRRKMW